jgi:hypothetical protein
MRTMFKTLVFMLMANLTFAQIFVGVRGGLTGSTMTKFKLVENITPDFKLLPAPSGAIFVEFPISDRIMPILAKFKLGDSNEGHAYVLLGPSVGYLFDSRLVISVLNIFPIRTGLGTGLFKDAEFSGIGALGYEIPFKNGKFFIEGRYQHGFSRVLNLPLVQLPVRNQSVGFSVGLSYALRSKLRDV